MTGQDWLVVACLLGVLALVLMLDRLRDLDKRHLERAEQHEAHRRLMGEIKRQP